MKRTIFISYRRDDSEGETGRLFDDLTREFGDQSVFMDVDGISPGMDFRQAIEENVSGCGVLLAIIGKTWAIVTTPEGHRRLDQPNDFVRLEIATALRRNVAVIPVLVHEAQMPHSDQLPDDLKDLAYRNSVEITHARWNSDVQLLIRALRNYVSPGASTDTHTVHANVPVQLPAPSAPATKAAPPPKPRRTLRIAIGAAAILVLALAFLYMLGRNPSSATPAGASAAQQGASNEQPVADSSARAANAGRGPGMPLHPDLYMGTWANPSPEPKNGLVRLQVFSEGDHLAIHAWGHCKSGECDWGTAPGTMNVARLEASFDLHPDATTGIPARTALVSVFPQEGALDVMISNTYAHRAATYRHFTFQPAQ